MLPLFFHDGVVPFLFIFMIVLRVEINFVTIFNRILINSNMIDFDSRLVEPKLDIK